MAIPWLYEICKHGSETGSSECTPVYGSNSLGRECGKIQSCGRTLCLGIRRRMDCETFTSSAAPQLMAMVNVKQFYSTKNK